MSQFYASIQGNRGEATRMGTKESGMSGYIRSWDIGCRATMNHVDNEDYIHITLTSNNGTGSERFLGTFTAVDLEKTPPLNDAELVSLDEIVSKPVDVKELAEKVAELVKKRLNLNEELCCIPCFLYADELSDDLADLFTASDSTFDREEFFRRCGL